MESPPLPYLTLDELECEIVDGKRRYARIIVYLTSESSVKVLTKDNEVLVLAKDSESRYRHCKVKLWFKPKRVSYKVNNGVLVIDAKGSILGLLF